MSIVDADYKRLTLALINRMHIASFTHNDFSFPDFNHIVLLPFLTLTLKDQ